MGLFKLSELEKLLEEYSPKLISLIAAHNESGVLQPWREVLKFVRHGNMVSLRCYPMDGEIRPQRLKFLPSFSFSAHKFGGPKGVGGLFSCEPISFIKGGDRKWKPVEAQRIFLVLKE